MNRPISPFTGPQDAAAIEPALQESLRAVARHSILALRRIHDLTAPRMMAQLLQWLGDRKAAEAALVHCYADVWEQSGGFSPARNSAGVWLDAIARHRAISILRATPRLTPPEEVDASLQILQATLDEQGMSPPQSMLRLAWCSARSVAEIARALQLPFNQVRQEIRSSLAAMIDVPTEAALPGAGRRGRLLEQLAGAYALGALTPRASRRFEALMAQDITVRRAWQRWEERLASFTLDVPPVRPPDSTWAAIARRLEGPAAAQVRSPRRWLIAVVLLLAAAVVFVWTQRSGR
jgi:DNA-directed RNA polymerase specialized sigma24 family protein